MKKVALEMTTKISLDFQEVSEDYEIDSDDEWDNGIFVDMPELKVKKRRETVFEELYNESDSYEESN